RQAGYVEDFVGVQPLFGPAAGSKKPAFKAGFVELVWGVDENVLYPREAPQGLVAAGAVVGGDDSPAGDVQPVRRQLFLQDHAGVSGQRRIGVEEDAADRPEPAQA